MTRWMWKAALAAVSATLLISVASWAQDEDVSECENACYEAEEACYEACEDSDEPATCEADCKEQAEACLDACE